jgi:hypothetical protein
MFAKDKTHPCFAAAENMIARVSQPRLRRGRRKMKEFCRENVGPQSQRQNASHLLAMTYGKWPQKKSPNKTQKSSSASEFRRHEHALLPAKVGPELLSSIGKRWR